MNEADLIARVETLFKENERRNKDCEFLRNQWRQLDVEHRSLFQIYKTSRVRREYSDHDLSNLNTLVKLTKQIQQNMVKQSKAKLAATKSQNEWHNAVVKLDTFKIQSNIKRQWTHDRSLMVVSHPKLNSWFQVSFSQARDIAKSYISFSIWTEYWESKYKFHRILKCLSLAHLQRLQPKLTSSSFAAILWSNVSWDKTKEIQSIIARLSNMKSLGHHEAAFKFVRTVCILFRDIR